MANTTPERFVLCPKCNTEIPLSVNLNLEPSTDDLTEKLRSYYTLSESELTNTASSVEDLDQRISWYDEEIGRLETILRAVQEQRELTSVSRAKKAASLNLGVRKLPPEILGQIFSLYCNDTNNGFRQRHTSRPYVAPLSLSHVCSLWRAIVHNFPNLWTIIHPDTSPGGSELVSLCVRLSKQLPLTIHLTGTSSLSVLTRYSDRWQSAFLELTFTKFQYLVQSSISFPLLTVLAITIQYSHPAEWLFGLPDADSWVSSVREGTFDDISPILRELLLDVPHSLPPQDYNLWFNRCTLPLSRITSLTLVGVGEECCEIIQHCPSLECFQMDSYRNTLYHPDMNMSNLKIFTSNITSLTISASDHQSAQVISGLFAFLRLPHLQRLEIRSTPCRSVEWSMNSFSSMMSRVPCPLSIIHLEYVYISQYTLVRVLDMMPNLTLFSLSPVPQLWTKDDQMVMVAKGFEELGIGIYWEKESILAGQ
ncbi:hypothetical protein D9758_005872 [Tetrapyrgos nigripes]|uniref:F-box domain-containing protein n=1 Tax=Tetrapyrgos nigripes TaxID=182062 RepID=A0A8H5G2R9_9AGAR|nr:hypothetical protein D9758_005872 [Tetrapyrgos nigripes]